jgi:hypothetical protein
MAPLDWVRCGRSRSGTIVRQPAKFWTSVWRTAGNQRLASFKVEPWWRGTPHACTRPGMARSSTGPHNNELQRTSDGNAAGSPLNSVLGRRQRHSRWAAHWLCVVAMTTLPTFPACAKAIPAEPLATRQLWQEKGCFAHELPPWRHVEARSLSGVVVGGFPSGEEPVREAVVYARRWPTGPVLEARTHEDGQFTLPSARAGLYELTACLPGFNPWRGTVRVRDSASTEAVRLPLMLGW